MDMQFTRKEQYGDLIGGVINYGPGKAFNIATDLPENGVLVTSVPALQQALTDYRGVQGYVFDAVIVKPDGTEVPAEREEPPAKRLTRTPAEAVAERATEDPEVIHSLATGYELLGEDELRATIASMGLAYPTDGDKGTLVNILEKADKGA